MFRNTIPMLTLGQHITFDSELKGTGFNPHIHRLPLAPPRPAPPLPEPERLGSRQPLLGPLCGIRPSRKSGYYGCLVVCRAVKTRH
ncbi:unnamed protein product [Merluccius merluccius]